MLDKFRVCFISFSDIRGGAAKAAARIKHAVEVQNVDVEYVVAERKETDSHTIGPSKFHQYIHFFLRCVAYLALKFVPNENTGKKSLNLFSSKHVLNNIKAHKLLHVHWFNNETLSLTALVKISQQKRMIITLHDEWLFSGVEHYNNDFLLKKNGAKKTKAIRLFKINKSIKEWKRSKVNRIENACFTVPSSWMLQRAKQSGFFNNHSVSLIPNAVPTNIFYPRPTKYLKQSLGVKNTDFIIAFGAIDALNNPLKGLELLNEALERLKISPVIQHSKVQLLVFGNKKTGQHICGFNTIYLGEVKKTEKLAEIYSCASLVIQPSLVESFGQVAAESLACETPVVAFNYSGIKDIIKHKESGYLATPYDVDDLVKGIEWLYQLPDNLKEVVGKSGRSHVIENFSEKVVAEKFIKLYKSQLNYE